MQRDDISVAPLLTDMDWSVDVWLVFKAESPARGLRRRIKTAPASALDGAQEGFEMGVECCRLFEIDGVAGVRRYPEAGIWQGRLQHQVGLETGRILVTNDEQDRGGHGGELITQIVQRWS